MIVNQRVNYSMADIVDIGIDMERRFEAERALQFLKKSCAEEHVIIRVLSAEGLRRKQHRSIGLTLVRYRWRTIF